MSKLLVQKICHLGQVKQKKIRRIIIFTSYEIKQVFEKHVHITRETVHENYEKLMF